jgi:ABC-2 type transport system permease protein
VNDVLLLARTHILTALRERVTLFWFLIFPVFLLVILSLIFGQIGQQGEITFDVSVVNFDASTKSVFSGMIEGVFKGLAQSDTAEEDPLFALRHPETDEDLDSFLAAELTAVRRGRRAAVIVIPEGFGLEIERRVVSSGGPGGSSTPDEPSLTIYYSEGNAASGMAVSIINQVLAGVNREILARSGRFDRTIAIEASSTWVGSEPGGTVYVDFLLPGIVLMGFFTNSLFGIPGAILFSRDQRVLRRYWVTPLSVPRYLGGLSIGHLALCTFQFGILLAVGRFGLGSTVSFASLSAALHLLLAAATFMAFGFLIASLARTANAGMAIANILNMPMMFLSGLFFPITGLPVFIRAIVYVNPVSYLADGLRAAVGVESGVFPTALVIAVPLGWIALSIGVASWRLRWDVAR